MDGTTANPIGAWQDVFVGREAELGTIRNAWSRAKNHEPGVVALIAESRLGKTRIVQEFYSVLSLAQDGNHYWPDWLSNERGNLSVNPAFDPAEKKRRGDMPWLWWGLRWTAPDLRNAAEVRQCAALDDLHHLEPHLVGLALQAEAREALTGVGLTFVGTLLGLIPGLSVVGSIRDIAESAGTVGKIIEAKRIAALDVARSRRHGDDNALERLFSLLTQILGTDALSDDGLPTILVLDDAQWADRDSLRLILRLLRRARERSWPLLVIATHWEQEWNRHEREPLGPAASSSPSNLSELLRVAAIEEGSGLSTLVLEPLDDLGAIIDSGLPGLTEPQRGLVATKAGGNPGLLHEIILHYQAKPICFIGRDVAAAFSETTERELQSREFDLHSLVEQRMADLGETVRELLGLGSYQGYRFSRALTLELASRILDERGSPGVDIGASLEAAHRPHALVQEVASATSEFRQRIYHEISLRYLHQQDRADATRLHVHLRGLLREKLAPDVFARLTTNDQEALARLAIQEFGEEGSEGGRRWTDLLEATAALIGVLDMQGQMAPLEDAWTAWTRLTAGEGPGAARNLSLPRHRQLITVAAELAEGEVAESMARDFMVRLGDERGLDGRSRNIEKAAGAQLLAEVLRQLDRPAEAETFFRQSVDLRREITNGPTSEVARLRGLAHALNGLGSTLEGLDQPETAEPLLREAVEIGREIARKDGASGGHFAPLAESIYSLASILQERGEPAEAEALLLEGLNLVQALPDFWSSVEHPRHLGDLSHQLGVLLHRLGRLVESESVFRVTAALYGRVLTVFGPSASRLHDLAVSQGSLGQVLRDLGKEPEAIRLYQESIDIHRAILQEFGASASSLAGLRASLLRMAGPMLDGGMTGAAVTPLREAVELDRLRLERYGPSAGRLRDLSSSLNWLGQVHRARGEFTDAAALGLESVELDRRVVREFRRTATRIKDLRASAIYLADVHAEERSGEGGEGGMAVQLYEEALDLDRLVMQEYGRSQDRLGDIAFTLLRLAGAHQSAGADLEAEAAARESLVYIRERVDEFGQAADALSGAAVALMTVSTVAERRGDLQAANAACRESLAYAQRCVVDFPNEGNCRSLVAHLTAALAGLEDAATPSHPTE